MTTQISLRRVLSHGLRPGLKILPVVTRSCLPRRYVSTTAGTQLHKGPVTAKGTAKASHAPPPPASAKGATSRKSKKGTSPIAYAAETAAQKESSAQMQQQAAQEALSPMTSRAKKFADMSDEDKEVELKRMLQYAELMPTVDPFGQEVTDTLDVMIPYPTSWSPAKQNVAKIQSNTSNYFKNSAALSMLMNLDCVPGVQLNRHSKSFIQRMTESFKRFHVQSTEQDSLLAPFRQVALEMYEQLNEAVASRSDRNLRVLTTSSYYKQISQLVKSSLKTNPKGRMVWQLHRIIDPVQVVSLRVSQGYMGTNEPRFGNRFMIHALVKFDTEQSLEIYNSRGEALHQPARIDEPYAIVDAEKKPEPWRIPAAKRRVTEYLVMEKRMWVQGPWVFREQMWPESDEAEVAKVEATSASS